MMKKRKVGRLKNADHKHYGLEPTQIKSALDHIIALNWYNYFYEVKTAKKWLAEYCKREKISLRNVREINMTMCSIARMLNNGADVRSESIEYLHKKLADKVEPKIVDEVKVVKISSNKFPLDLFEEKLDEFYNADYKFFDPGVYALLRDLNARPIDCKVVVDYYSGLLSDLREYPDDYKYLGKRKYNSYIKFLTKMIEDAQSFSSNRKASKPRKPRRRRAVDPLKATSKVKYLKEEPSLQLVSVGPDRLVGAQIIWLYNVKYKKLLKYVAAEGSEMSVKGTSIQNYDPDQSGSKRLRKPAEQLKDIKAGTKARKLKAFNEIRAVTGRANGRINEHTIILGVQ